MITSKQNALYWRLWSQAKSAIESNRKTKFSVDETSRFRHEFHIRALGRDKSHLDFTNRELDFVLAQFRSIITPFGPSITNHRSPSTAAEAQRRRLYFGLRGMMRRLRLSENYVQAIADRMFFKIPLNLLATNELQKLIIALKQHERRNAA